MLVAVDRIAPHLPTPRTSFVGRERAIDALTNVLRRPDVSLVTLTGAGGSGKTRLALAVASELIPDFDRVCFVDLAPVHDPAHVPNAIARALDLREGVEPSLADHIAHSVADARLLLVLDNFEQVLGAAPFIARLLDTVANLTVLATSRASLALSGERDVPVEPLAVPTATATASIDELLAFPAVQLFVERAEAARPDFCLTLDNGPVVAEICRRLDGLPLAIELAAARLKVLSPRALLARLSSRLQVLTGGPTDTPTRLRTMRDAITWSYDLLTPSEQGILQRLSLFAGGFTLEAAEAVAGGQGKDVPSLTPTVLDGISSLVEKSLLRAIDGMDGDRRYVMLEVIREFGQERLGESADATEARDRFAAWFLALAEQAPAELRQQAIDPRWLRRVDPEFGNLRAALDWLTARGQAAATLSLCSSTIVFWFLRGTLQELTDWFERALALPGQDAVPPSIRAKALTDLGYIYFLRGDLDPAERLVGEGLTLYQTIGADAGASYALSIRGKIAMERRQVEHARADFEAVIALLSKPATTTPHKDAGRRWLTLTQLDVGCFAIDQGDLARAESLIQECLLAFQEMDDPMCQSAALGQLGRIAVDRGDQRQAATYLAEALARWKVISHDDVLAEWLELVALLAAQFGAAPAAARLLGAADRLRLATGFAAVWPERSITEAATAATRRWLGDADFAAAWEAGRGMSAASTRAEMLAVLDASTQPGQDGQPSARDNNILTKRERDVLCLIAAGRTNAEIGEALFISRRTVSTHVEHIFVKLGVRSRVEAATYSRDHGIC